MFLNKQEVFPNGHKMVTLSGKIARYKIFVNVGDMEFNGGDERIAFGTMAKGQKKYGSTSSRLKRNEHLIVYNVSRGDTLQGIAVKFGITTEQIRRANQLWTNDSLFLRDKLLIPCTKNGHNNEDPNPSTSKSSCLETNIDLNLSCSNASTLSSPQEDSFASSHSHRPWSHPLSDSFESEDCVVTPTSIKLGMDDPRSDAFSSAVMNNSISAHDEWQSESGGGNNHSKQGRSYSSDSNGIMSPQASTSHASPTSPNKRCVIVDHSEKSAKDFLSRIDSAIASTRTQVKGHSRQSSMQWVTFDSDSESDLRQSSGTSVSTQGRHLRYSLRKLEKAQDELFQL